MHPNRSVDRRPFAMHDSLYWNPEVVMAYQHICDICGKPIFLNHYTSILVEEPKDRGPQPWHDAHKYDICNNCFFSIKALIKERMNKPTSWEVDL